MKNYASRENCDSRARWISTLTSERSKLLLIIIARNLRTTLKNGANHCCNSFYWLGFYFMDSQQCQQMEKVTHWIKTFELSTQWSSLLMGFSFRLDRLIQSFIVFSCPWMDTFNQDIFSYANLYSPFFLD